MIRPFAGVVAALGRGFGGLATVNGKAGSEFDACVGFATLQLRLYHNAFGAWRRV